VGRVRFPSVQMFVRVVFSFMATIFEDYLAAADAAVGLLASGEVAGRWAGPSACEGFTVGGLAAHLGWQVESARWAVESERPAAGAVATELTAHYALAAWIGTGLESPANVGIRDRGEQRAEVGAAETVRLAREAREYLAERFASLTPGEPIAVPWVEGRVLTVEDLLTTRLLELLIHADDLAVSADVLTPEFPESAYARVIDVLTRLSVQVNGPLAVLRALSRSERAPKSVSAF
jgi:Mycothiol maleylpyruvate isomerase N-terminal domain